MQYNDSFSYRLKAAEWSLPVEKSSLGKRKSTADERLTGGHKNFSSEWEIEAFLLISVVYGQSAGTLTGTLEFRKGIPHWACIHGPTADSLYD